LARILIVGGGIRGLRLTGELIRAGHAVRVTTRRPEHRDGIDRAGGECWIGDPNRLATLRQALDNVTVACWFLATATGPEEQIHELHTSRLKFFLSQVIDTTVRGVLYETAAVSAANQTAAAGTDIARTMSSRNAIPLRLIQTAPTDQDAWATEVNAAIDSIVFA
jgi:hypothetical protein